ncbi:hypothetical protein [Salinactinospora qingdaonensis]|uniref:Uncharacterized protein n=1 Tax=Salinactinospora qingdaonensis TaxID=702744 RepID=A0ABP7FED7_9ACTN
MNSYTARLERLRARFPVGSRVALEGNRVGTVRGVAPLSSGTIVVWLRVRGHSLGLDPFNDIYRLPGELTPPEGVSR